MQLSNNSQGERPNEKRQACASCLTIWYKFNTDSKEAQFRKCITKLSKGEWLMPETAVNLILDSVFGDVHPCKLEILSWRVDEGGDYYLQCKRDYKQKFCSTKAIPVVHIELSYPAANVRKLPQRKRRWRSRSRSPPSSFYKRRRKKKRRRRGRRWG